MKRKQSLRDAWLASINGLPEKQRRAKLAKLKRKKGLNKIGRRGRENAASNKRIDAELKRHGIDRCEMCGGNFILTRAHAVKRRFLSKNAAPGTSKHPDTAALLCVACHDNVEALPHTAMRDEIMRIISRRREL